MICNNNDPINMMHHTLPKKTSLQLFIGLWNTQQNLLTPKIHLKIAAWLSRQSRNIQKRLLLMAFRGCGKSTLVGLFCAWLLCHNPDLRILIIAADESLAENMLQHIRTIIETHPIARNLLPAKKQIWSADRVLVQRLSKNRDPSIRAAGIHSNITGARADIIICDDVEVPNTCDSKTKRDKLRQALHELDFILVPDGMILYIGTPHSEESIYKKDGFLATYTRLEIPLTPQSWPERFTQETIDTIAQHVGHRVFSAQMLLQAVSPHDAQLNPDMIGVYNHDITAAHISCYWDPAFGHKNGDHSVIALVLFDEQDHAHIHDILYITLDEQSPIDAATQQCRAVIGFLQRHNIRHLRIESNGIGQFLPGLLRKELRIENYRCGTEIIHNSMNKNKRILHAFEARLAARAISMHERVSKTEFAHEMRLWQADTNHNQDDALDAVAGALIRHTPRFTYKTQYYLQQD